MDEESEYGHFEDWGCDDLGDWEAEQCFQDREGFDDFGDFGVDGIGPDFE